ncbi:MoaD/ThiS family protein [Mycobacterium sp. PS03-16]|uniref:MoaD/ThiS family protein n=1 Tax=Mycobacterium sp. PS03-16 TaxID=2559611 RepID=UPI0010739491|nr:MoaD/ThiS family protein [Mycobacterium sp. PS03-16]TFV56238.1 MoaD/ThiS family protein [Mycobacterium sp. PS03-16]
MSTSTTVRVTVRYFAAARAAAGTAEEELSVPAGTTVQDVLDRLSERDPELTRVMARCSYLCDGIAVRDTTIAVRNASTLDVLPPFAGG